VREIFMAVHLERRFTKRAILQTYLNRIYFGASYYGVEAAARGYFGKPALELGPHEAAALAAAIKAPAYYSPIHQTPFARARRQAVLAAMADAAALSQEAYAVARRTPVEIAGPPRMHDETDTAHAPGDTTLCGLYFKAAVRRQLVQQFGWHRVYQGGLRVYTTVDPAMQHAAERALDRRLAEITSTRGAGDASRPLQGALVAIDPPTGHVRALVGGRDFHRSPFDRATQARRQPGSAFKPLLYAAAIEDGYTPGMRLSGLGDAVEAGEGAYRPADHDDASSFTLRRALTISSNRAAVHLLQDIGPRTLIRYARRFGISTRLPAVPSLALGTGEVTLFELTAAFGALANEGVLSAPVLIRRVEDASGLVLYEDPQIRRRAVKRTTAYLVTSMLADVVNRGSGYRVRRHGFTLAAAGKTGTTDDYGDAWFLGYTPQLAAGVWFGFDVPDTIMSGGYGGVVAAPAWADFMTKATAGHEPKRFARPSEIVDVPVCPVSGQRAVSACYLAAAVAHGTPTMVGEGDGESAGPAPTTIAIDLAVEGSRAAEPCAFHGPRVAPAGGIRAGPPTSTSRPGLVGTLLP
jgi:penicillin-binding protein 1A